MSRLLVLVAIVMAGCSAVPKVKPGAAGDVAALEKQAETSEIDARAARDDIILTFGPSCPRPEQGRWIYGTNKNTMRPVYATIQIDAAPISYPIIDWALNRRSEHSPLYPKQLFAAGERLALGCESQRITDTSTTVAYKYSIAGAHYPNPNTPYPDTDVARDFVRIIDRPGAPDPEACGSPGTPSAFRYIRNAHPRKTLRVHIVGVVGDPTASVYTLNAEEVKFAGCNNNPTRVMQAEFI